MKVIFSKPFQLLLGLVLGAGLGLLFHSHASDPGWAWLGLVNKSFLAPVGQVFLRLLFMIVVPLIFSALVLGIYELGKSRGFGKVAVKTILYTIILSSFSVIVGITLANVLKPGQGVPLDPVVLAEQKADLEKIQKNAAAAKPFSQIVVELIPSNPLSAAVNAFQGEMIAFMIFSVIFGVALSLLGRQGDIFVVRVLEEIFAISIKIVGFALAIAPFAVFAIVFGTAFKYGGNFFKSLLFYVGVVVLGLIIQQVVVYGIMLWVIARRSPIRFFSACREVYLYAFSTASSNATLPKSLELAETKLGLPPKISRFVLTIGATANQNGTALFEGVTVLFLAQVYGVHLDLGAQVTVVLMSILAGIGTAGVPGGSLPLIMILLTSVGIPAEGLALILGVDRFLDMCRTTLNVSGDLVIAALVSGKVKNPEVSG